MTTYAFSDRQVDKARHALGLTRKKRAYRNYYASDPDPDWDDLVERGLAVKRECKMAPDFFYYHLTRRAAFMFLNEGEALDPELKFAVEPAALVEEKRGG